MAWVLKYRYLFLIVLVVLTIIAIFVAITFNTTQEKAPINPAFLYNTWKVEKLYKNGKLVVNNNKYQNLFFQVNRDGTAEWIKGNKKIKISIIISPDGSQIITDNGLTLEEVETVFELRPTVLRFGKRAIHENYEYVMTAADVKGGNFLQ